MYLSVFVLYEIHFLFRVFDANKYMVWQSRFSSLLTLLLGSAASTLCSCASLIVLVIIVVMRLQDALSKLLLASVDVSVELVAVLANRKLLIVVDRNVDTACTYWLVLRIVELRDVGVTQGLLCRQASIWVELEQVAKQVKCVVRSRGEHITKTLWLGRW